MLRSGAHRPGLIVVANNNNRPPSPWQKPGALKFQLWTKRCQIKQQPMIRALSEKRPAVSVIIPVYNEVGSIGTLVENVGIVMQERGGPYEVVCVDDGSTDGTTRLLKTLASTRDDMRVVIFRRNFGQTAAMAAGMEMAAGEVLITMDGDLQNDAQDIPRLVDQLLLGNQGGRVVDTGVVLDDGGFDLVKLHDYGCSLKAYRASLVSSIRLVGEMHRFIPAVAAMEGAAICELEVRHHPRRQGKSKYGLGRIIRVLLDLTTILFLQRFRDKPMHMMGFLGALCILGSLVAAVVASYSAAKTAQVWGYGMALATARPGLVLSLQLLIMGLQLVCLGLIAEVCVRSLYSESQPRPVYRVREVVVSSTETVGSF